MPRTKPFFTLRELYDAYPDADLLPISPPTAKSRIAPLAENCADRFFEYLLFELCSEKDAAIENKREVLRRIDRAINDLKAIRKVVFAKSDGDDTEICICGDPFHDGMAGCARCGRIRPSIVSQS